MKNTVARIANIPPVHCIRTQTRNFQGISRSRKNEAFAHEQARMQINISVQALRELVSDFRESDGVG